jgi:hypothetical protein
MRLRDLERGMGGEPKVTLYSEEFSSKRTIESIE